MVPQWLGPCPVSFHLFEAQRLSMKSVCDHRDLHRVDRRQRQMCIRDSSTTACVFGSVLFWLLTWAVNYGTAMARTMPCLFSPFRSPETKHEIGMRPPRSTQSRSSAASDVYKRQQYDCVRLRLRTLLAFDLGSQLWYRNGSDHALSLIHISEPTRLGMISYAVF